MNRYIKEATYYGYYKYLRFIKLNITHQNYAPENIFLILKKEETPFKSQGILIKITL